MKTSHFIFILLSLSLQSCVTESVPSEKTATKKIFGARLKQGDIKIESLASKKSDGTSDEVTLSSQLHSLPPGFYQISIAHISQCPAANTVIDANINRDESDPFYISDEKPQTILRHMKMVQVKGMALLTKQEDKTQKLISCAPIKTAVIK